MSPPEGVASPVGPSSHPPSWLRSLGILCRSDPAAQRIKVAYGNTATPIRIRDLNKGEKPLVTNLDQLAFSLLSVVAPSCDTMSGYYVYYAAGTVTPAENRTWSLRCGLEKLAG